MRRKETNSQIAASALSNARGQFDDLGQVLLGENDAYKQLLMPSQEPRRAVVGRQLKLTFSEGLIGFECATEFVLSSSRVIYPFKVLQSLDDLTITFIVADPRFFFKDYHFELSSADIDLLKLSSREEAAVLSILLVPKDPLKMTANLLAPLVMNEKERLGKQVILHNSSYPVDQRIFVPDACSSRSLSLSHLYSR